MDQAFLNQFQVSHAFLHTHVSMSQFSPYSKHNEDELHMSQQQSLNTHENTAWTQSCQYDTSIANNHASVYTALKSNQPIQQDMNVPEYQEIAIAQLLQARPPESQIFGSPWNNGRSMQEQRQQQRHQQQLQQQQADGVKVPSAMRETDEMDDTELCEMTKTMLINENPQQNPSSNSINSAMQWMNEATLYEKLYESDDETGSTYEPEPYIKEGYEKHSLVPLGYLPDTNRFDFSLDTHHMQQVIEPEFLTPEAEDTMEVEEDAVFSD